MSPPENEITRLLHAWGNGAEDAREELIPLVFDELRAVARRQLASERPGHTLQPTALVHEVYIRLVRQKNADWQDRRNFFAVAGSIARRVLVDHARKRRAEKRGSDGVRVTLDEGLGLAVGCDEELVALDDALRALQDEDSRGAQVVELHVFGGLKHDEIAEHLDISRTTVTRDWTHAKLWLKRYLENP